MTRTEIVDEMLGYENPKIDPPDEVNKPPKVREAYFVPSGAVIKDPDSPGGAKNHASSQPEGEG